MRIKRRGTLVLLGATLLSLGCVGGDNAAAPGGASGMAGQAGGGAAGKGGEVGGGAGHGGTAGTGPANGCAAKPSPCNVNAACTAPTGVVVCVCKMGYTGDGFTCADIDECMTANGGCDPRAVCSNTPGGRTCACPVGFSGDGSTCADVDECASANGGCDPQAVCGNTPGGRTCACRPGFSGDGTVCSDVDECASKNGGCDPKAVCSNAIGTHACTCKSGFVGDGLTCADVDECANHTSGCDSKVTCANTSGSFMCGACPAGFTDGGTAGCVDIDECLPGMNICSTQASCSNSAGTYACACNSGFSGNGIRCDACATSCATGKYLSASCTTTTAAVCTTCSSCLTGQYVAVACGGSNDTGCGICDAHCNACTGEGACTACATGFVLNAGACVVPAKSCLTIHLANSAAPSGAYGIDPDGGSTDNAFSAYCDMTHDGGGWMKILQYHDTPYNPSAGAIGNIAVPGTAAMAKLADANVNRLASLATNREYRFQGDISPKKLFIKSNALWDDTARGEGLVLNSQVLACSATTNCAYVNFTTNMPTIDTNNGTPLLSDNDADRYFTDYGGNPDCYTYGYGRCYSAGVSTSHALIPNLSIWVREVPVTSEGLAVYPLDENSGTTAHDASGNGLDAAFITGSWTPGHSGSALLGSMRTLAAVPVTDAVTVSLWVRRDGVGTGYPRILSWDWDGLDLADVASGNSLGVYTSVLGWQPIGTNFGAGFHHIAVTGGDGTLVVYFDGAPVYTTPLVLNLSGPMSIGTRWDGVESWNGAFDQVRVYDRALTPAEITTLAHE